MRLPLLFLIKPQETEYRFNFQKSIVKISPCYRYEERHILKRFSCYFRFFLGLLQQHGGGSGSHCASLVSILHNGFFSGPLGVTNSSSILHRRSPFGPTFATLKHKCFKHYSRDYLMVYLVSLPICFVFPSIEYIQYMHKIFKHFYLFI